MAIANNNLFDLLNQVKANADALNNSIGDLQNAVTGLQEENAELAIENEKLRAMLKQVAPNQGEEPLTKSRENLKELYQQGFHVCNEYFGKHLAKNESCTFCLDAIFGRHDQPTPGAKE